MTLSQLLDRAGLADLNGRARALFEQLPVDAPQDWRRLAAVLALRYEGRPVTVGIGGGQGAGKSTLAALLEQALTVLGRKAVCLSLDDFYLSRSEREALGETVHPLLATRGVPGTHDVQRARSVLRELQAGGACSCPGFDKSIDDRFPDSQARPLGPGVEAIIFEGWCVGAVAQPASALVDPCNELERIEDPHGHWRRFVNARLAQDYVLLWEMLDEQLFLQVPGIDAVVRWRTQQEQQHPVERRMSSTALERFVAHYERLTMWMSATLPERAKLIGLLDENHGLIDLTLN